MTLSFDSTLSRRDHLLMEAAQCAWEHVDGATDTRLAPGPWKALRESQGTAALRAACRNVAPLILNAHDIAKAAGQDVDCYDWEFVPWVMENLLQKDADGLPLYNASQSSFYFRDDWVDLAAVCNEPEEE